MRNEKAALGDPAVILTLSVGSKRFPEMNHLGFALIVIAGYILLNLVENQVLVPRILGSAVSLPPVVVLIGVTIGGKVAGIAGVFLATPVMASGREVLKYVHRKITETPEVPPKEEIKLSFRDQVRGFGMRVFSVLRRKPKDESRAGASR